MHKISVNVLGFTYDDPGHHETATAPDGAPQEHEVDAEGHDAADDAEDEEPGQVHGGGGRHVPDLLVGLLVNGALLVITPDLVLPLVQVSKEGVASTLVQTLLIRS